VTSRSPGPSPFGFVHVTVGRRSGDATANRVIGSCGRPSVTDMRGSVARRWFSGAVGVLVLLLLPACATASGDDLGPPLPTFEAAAPDSADGATPQDGETGLPDDCERVLRAADLDSVGSRTTIGVPAPSVGRTERVACAYTATGPTGDLRRGAALLDVNSAAYVDDAAAAGQWRVNAEAEDGAAREFAIGAARAVLVERPGEAVLMVVNRSSTVTLVLPDEVRVGDLEAQEILVDLALRVLPQVSGQASAAPPTDPPAPGAVS
jgi:hypothetical protein